MGIRLIRFPEYRLDLNIYTGQTSAAELFHHLCRLESAADWLSYFDATANLCGIKLTHFPALKHAVTAMEYKRDGGEPRRHALVNIPERNELFVRFWCRYVTSGVPIAHKREIFPTLEDACRWLGLPPTASQALTRTIAATEPAAARGVWAVPRRSAAHARPGLGAARP